MIKKADILFDHILVYTNQNYDFNLSGRFFQDLNIRKPDYTFEYDHNSFATFLAMAFIEFERIIKREQPDKILLLGDTNSGLLAIIANRYKIPVYHLEAGNRCFDERVPEESNRRIIDSVSTINLPYTENSKQNLLAEGYHKNSVFKVGNPIFEVMEKWKKQINASDVAVRNNIPFSYVLLTTHRSENVDNKETLSNIVNTINEIANRFTVVIPLHPHTKKSLERFNLAFGYNTIVIEPCGFFDFIYLEKYAVCVISDSGTVQEECCILGIPSVTIRNSTERQETIECGSNILSGTTQEEIIRAFNSSLVQNTGWTPPPDYLIPNVSDIVMNILAGK